MAKKRKSIKKSGKHDYLLYLGIVLVAVVVVAVVLFSNIYKSGDVAGQAVKIGGVNYRIVCEDFNLNYYSDTKPIFEKTGYQFCRDNGFDTCAGVNSQINLIYFPSTDKSCEGSLQLADVASGEVPCSSKLNTNPIMDEYGIDEECLTFADDFSEPIYGDFLFEHKGTMVNCCKLINK